MAYLEVRRLAGMRSPWMMSTGPLQQIAVGDGPGYEAARNAASVAAREDGLVGLVAGVVVVYRLVEPDGDDQVGWLYDGSKAEALTWAFRRTQSRFPVTIV